MSKRNPNRRSNAKCICEKVSEPVRVRAKLEEHGMLVWMGSEIYWIPDYADEAWPLSKLFDADMARRKYAELFGRYTD